MITLSFLLQDVKDWHLLLLSIGIVMIDVVCVGPLLILNYVYGDTWYEPDYENPPSINVSDYLLIVYTQFSVVMPKSQHMQPHSFTSSFSEW